MLILFQSFDSIWIHVLNCHFLDYIKSLLVLKLLFDISHMLLLAIFCYLTNVDTYIEI